MALARDVDQLDDVEPAKRDITTPTTRRTVSTGGAAGSSGGVFLRISRRRKTRYGGFE
jgi:hypothetical protein